MDYREILWTLSILLSAAPPSGRLNAVEEKLVLIDTDAGVDDAWAMLMLLKAHQDPDSPFKIVGLTCVRGNTCVDNVIQNVAQTLKIGGESNIPVYRGCETPLDHQVNKYETEPMNGKDGFGDSKLPPVEFEAEDEHGVKAIIRLAEQYQGRLTILALGPLTNLAVAARLEPRIKDWVKAIMFMGGKNIALSNNNAVVGFNVHSDVEAASEVFRTFSGAITVVPWETCAALGISVKSRRELGKTPTTKMQFLNVIEANLLNREEGLEGNYYVGDQLAAAILLEPAVKLSYLARQTSNCYTTVKTVGQYTKSLVANDKESILLGNPPILKFVDKVDSEQFEHILLWSVHERAYKENSQG